MAVIHISEPQFTEQVASLLNRARAGEEIIINDELGAVRLSRVSVPAREHLHPRYTEPRLLSEILADLEANPSSNLMPEGFADDVDAVIASHENEMVFDPWAAS